MHAACMLVEGYCGLLQLPEGDIAKEAETGTLPLHARDSDFS